MTSGDVKDIDIIVRKKPGGNMVTMQLENVGNGNFRVKNIMGAGAADYQNLRQIAGLMGALLTGNLVSASIRTGPTGNLDIQAQTKTAVQNQPLGQAGQLGIGATVGKPLNLGALFRGHKPGL